MCITHLIIPDTKGREHTQQEVLICILYKHIGKGYRYNIHARKVDMDREWRKGSIGGKEEWRGEGKGRERERG